MQNEIMDVAQDLIQRRGYNAFSYNDIATKIGIKTSSIHYYFPKKEDLSVALVKRYRTVFGGLLADISNSDLSSSDQIDRFVSLFVATLRDDAKLCLCGMLAAEFDTISEKTQKEVKVFFDESEAWLAGVLETGRETGEFLFEGDGQPTAATFFAALNGAMLSVRIFGDESRLTKTAEHWKRGIGLHEGH